MGLYNYNSSWDYWYFLFVLYSFNCGLGKHYFKLFVLSWFICICFQKKDLLEAKWWAIIFWANIILLAVVLVDSYLVNGAISNALPFLNSGRKVTNTEVIITIIISLPALYATYLLSKGKDTKKK